MTGQTELKAARDAKKNGSSDTTVCVYGYGTSNHPFYKEAHAIQAHPNGCLLLLGAAVNRGQKLLLMNSRQSAAEVEIVNARSVSGQWFEVEVSFPSPRPDFWQFLQ